MKDHAPSRRTTDIALSPAATATPRAALLRVRFLDVSDDSVIAECDAASAGPDGLWSWADELVTTKPHTAAPWMGRTKIAFELTFEGLDPYRGRIDLWPSLLTYRGRRSYVWPLSLHVRHMCMAIGRGLCPSFLSRESFRPYLAQYGTAERAAFAVYLDAADLGGDHPMPWRYAAA